jgi:hypothetical protein
MPLYASDSRFCGKTWLADEHGEPTPGPLHVQRQLTRGLLQNYMKSTKAGISLTAAAGTRKSQ